MIEYLNQQVGVGIIIGAVAMILIFVIPKILKKKHYELNTIRQLHWDAVEHLRQAWKNIKEVDTVLKQIEEDINKQWG